MAGDNQNDGWWKNNAVALTPIAISLLTLAYFGIIKGNTAENDIAVLKTRAIELQVKVDIIDNKKVDKETFIMLMTGQSEIKASIEKTNSLLLDHILKSKQ